jgi:peptide/nickel transport system ATP-binding protein
LLASIPGLAVGDRLPTIEGEVPTPTERPTTCRFAPRCPKAFGRCEEVRPSHVVVGEDHSTACLLFDERFEVPRGVDPEVGPPGLVDTNAPAKPDGGGQ